MIYLALNQATAFLDAVQLHCSIFARHGMVCCIPSDNPKHTAELNTFCNTPAAKQAKYRNRVRARGITQSWNMPSWSHASMGTFQRNASVVTGSVVCTGPCPEVAEQSPGPLTAKKRFSGPWLHASSGQRASPLSVSAAPAQIHIWTRLQRLP